MEISTCQDTLGKVNITFNSHKTSGINHISWMRLLIWKDTSLAQYSLCGGCCPTREHVLHLKNCYSTRTIHTHTPIFLLKRGRVLLHFGLFLIPHCLCVCLGWSNIAASHSPQTSWQSHHGLKPLSPLWSVCVCVCSVFTSSH